MRASLVSHGGQNTHTWLLLGIVGFYSVLITLWGYYGYRTEELFRPTMYQYHPKTQAAAESTEMAMSYPEKPHLGREIVNENSSYHPNRSCFLRVQYWTFSKWPPTLERGFHYCPETNCTVEFPTEENYGVMKSSHVVILHQKGNWDLEIMRSAKTPEQIIVYWTRESPSHSYQIETLGPYLFNWIASYHTRSQIHIPYGHIIGDRFPGSETKTKNWAAGKTGLAIWIASNCVTTTWPRTRFVSSLRRFMKIDTFGLCGDKKCPGDRASCLKLIKSYKFYLALENSQCEQYITEKTWRNALKHNSVSIVYGAPKSDYERSTPRNSFIHISDFSNMSSLAAYIGRIDRNDSMYDEFFAWRGEQVIVEEDEDVVFKEQHLCSISKMIKDSKTGRGDDVS